MEGTERRIKLANLLADAAELEHTVLCQYLFMAFSLKIRPEEGGVTWPQLEMMRRWRSDLLLIARQEMEHLGLVNNLLTAIGEAPHFARPNFPIPPRYFHPADEAPSLRPFGRRELLPFIRMEMPAEVDEAHRQTLAKPIPELAHSSQRPDHAIARLYGEIRTLFGDLDARDLFIGPPSAQLTPGRLTSAMLGGVGSSMRIVYGVKLEPVIDLPSALAVIDQIVEEGEGTEQDSADSHFGRLVRMYRELGAERRKEPSFEPARPVGPNPKTVNTGQRGVTVISNPDALALAELFDRTYETIVLMLHRYFTHTDESDPEIVGVQYAVFFPLMTAVLRPLGECLTLLPAGTAALAPTAGPSFDLGRRVALLPHSRAALRVLDLQLRDLSIMADRVCRASTIPEPVRDRLHLAAENLARIELTFSQTLRAGGSS